MVMKELLWVLVMPFSLSSQNVCEYLSEQRVCDQISNHVKIELKPAKNFNLLVTLEDGRKLLVKQERHLKNGETLGEFLKEWHVQKLINSFSSLAPIRQLFPEIVHFNPEQSIIVFNYLKDYRDLDEFFLKGRVFSEVIAGAIGTEIAEVHRLTFKNTDYKDFLHSCDTTQNESDIASVSHVYKIGRVTPEVFSSLPSDGLKFLSLYQRYDSLGEAISSLSNTYHSCCLIHQDFKLNNILLCDSWNEGADDPQKNKILRIIDWERCGWGDPASDLGSIIASYLQIWLSSLVVSSDMTIEESLRIATIPLELLQPSLNMLITTYLEAFPEILCQQPTFVQRVIQFSGLALIQQIRSIIQHQMTFSNTGVCMMQVAKSLLCRPEQSIATIFGESEEDLMSHYKSSSILAS
jgi:thiamine kinase-like enzyme